ncbi:MAG: hypothetical protein P3C10_13040 [Gemmatimonadota bacterium]|nr:hypothetical protein [Gemmatimonadota bacterium]
MRSTSSSTSPDSMSVSMLGKSPTGYARRPQRLPDPFGHRHPLPLGHESDPSELTFLTLDLPQRKVAEALVFQV